MSNTSIDVPFNRIFASGTLTPVDIRSAVSCPSSSAGGQYLTAQPLPQDYDRSRPASVAVYLLTGTQTLRPAGVIALVLDTEYQAPGLARVTLSSTLYVDIPLNWPNYSLMAVEMPFDATPPTYPGSTFPPNTLLGWRLWRDTADDADDWLGGIFMLAGIRMTYSPLCLECCPC
jgi:hypothetical protein